MHAPRDISYEVLKTRGVVQDYCNITRRTTSEINTASGHDIDAHHRVSNQWLARVLAAQLTFYQVRQYRGQSLRESKSMTIWYVPAGFIVLAIF